MAEANRRAKFVTPMRPSWFPLRAAALHDKLTAAGAPEWIVTRVASIDGNPRVRTPGHAWELSANPPN